MSDAGRVRAFLAVPPDPVWSESARELLARIRPALPDASWTRQENWHLTLRFLGEVTRDALDVFVAAVGQAAEKTPAAEVRTSGAAVFPPRGPARVLGAGFAPGGGAETLSRLGTLAERAAREAGLAPENRDFHPHVTFARVKRPWPRGAVARFTAETNAWVFPPWPIRSCVLYDSRLDPRGAVHTPIGRWELSVRGLEVGA